EVVALAIERVLLLDPGGELFAQARLPFVAQPIRPQEPGGAPALVRQVEHDRRAFAQPATALARRRERGQHLADGLLLARTEYRFPQEFFHAVHACGGRGARHARPQQNCSKASTSALATCSGPRPSMSWRWIILTSLPSFISAICGEL